MYKALFFLVFLFSSSIYGQTDLNESCTWSVSDISCADLTCLGRDFDEYISGDTIINTTTYYKVYRIGSSFSYYAATSSDTLHYVDFDTYHGAIRDDQGIWYWIPADSSDEMVLYDFNIAEGDSLTLLEYPDIKFALNLIEFIEHNGIQRKVYQIGETPFSIIEGVGFNTGLSSSLSKIFLLSGEYFSYLKCYSKDEDHLSPDLMKFEEIFGVELPEPCEGVISQTSEEIRIDLAVYPNPFEDRLRIILGMDIDKVQVYNIYGHRVASFFNETAEMEIDLSGVVEGVYFIVVESRGEIYRRTVIKMEGG